LASERESGQDAADQLSEEGRSEITVQDQADKERTREWSEERAREKTGSNSTNVLDASCRSYQRDKVQQRARSTRMYKGREIDKYRRGGANWTGKLCHLMMVRGSM